MEDALRQAQVLARDELREMETRGHEVKRLRAKYDRLAKAPSVEKYLALYEETHRLGEAPGYQGKEPSELGAIRQLRPPGPRLLPAPAGARLKDKILGGWLGRVAGCVLGKPVESWSKERIEQGLKKVREYPLADFFSRRFYRAAGAKWPSCCRPAIKYAERDDDTDYTILGLHLLEHYGFNFTPENVGEEWLSRFPYHLVYTAERAAYRNLVCGLRPSESASFRNPYREWIGAQIRADAFGLVSPGMPEAAAGLAFQDAALSTVKNGIYGAMWSAATTAAAFSGDDPEAALRRGMSEIPRTSRLYAALDLTLEWSKKDESWEKTWRRMMDYCGPMPSVHTINNAMIVALALLHGKGDFGQTVCTAVMCGLDTDCNGATAGAMMGVMLGAKNIPPRWYECFHDELRSALVGFQVNSIKELAARTYRKAKEHRRLVAGG